MRTVCSDVHCAMEDGRMGRHSAACACVEYLLFLTVACRVASLLLLLFLFLFRSLQGRSHHSHKIISPIPRPLPPSCASRAPSPSLIHSPDDRNCYSHTLTSKS